jgi:hypothetical protein
MSAPATAEAEAGTTEAYYVYGIVPADAPVDLVADQGMGAVVQLHADGPLGALVEVVDPDRPLGRRKDPVAHSTVLNTMAEQGPVLPMRFGSVLQSAEAVVEELLRPQRDHFSELLEEVSGLVQFTLRARYVLDTVLAEIVEAEPEVAELRRRTADLPEDATHFERIRLGELVARAVDVRRRVDTEELLDRVTPLARDVVVREVSGLDALSEFALLVDTDAQDDLVEAAEAWAMELDGRIQLSLVGPMALYDFVPEQ